MPYQKELGNRGEQIALAFLQGKGLRFLEKNFHAQGGEIDLIFFDPTPKEYVFVEVKTRRSNSFGDGIAAITLNKFEKILRAAEDFFLKKMKMQEVPFFRVDVVIVRIDRGGVFTEYVQEIGFDDFR
ncbi:YraN family protein [Candidatus Gracilibacteria bacterium]|nr:YraN family protein [Candidatus Gracilibacteria bacterium]